MIKIKDTGEMHLNASLSKMEVVLFPSRTSESHSKCCSKESSPAAKKILIYNLPKMNCIILTMAVLFVVCPEGYSG